MKTFESESGRDSESELEDALGDEIRETGFNLLDSEDERDSEAELQAALSEGRLKPGLNIEKLQKIHVNNEVALNWKLNNIALKLPWIERLDINSKDVDVSKIPPELRGRLDEEKTKNTDDLVFNDFQREMIFHCHAQAAVLEGIRRLKELGIPTKRPDDYFAEMAKSDSHMQKVRAFLLSKQKGIERAEKVREIRKMRKINKELQKQARVQKVQEKREFMDQVKKYRQKMTTDLNFLDSKSNPKGKNVANKGKILVNRKAEAKRKFKQDKYGMGGKKKGSKHNTKESAADVFGGRKSGKKMFGNNKKQKSRPGKSKRAKQKGGKRR